MTKPTQADGAPIDPERPEPRHALDTLDGYSGQDYHVDRERAALSDEAPPRPDADEPAEAGRRASIDRESGEVHGSGSGAGGGGAGEDHDPDRTGGGGYPRTGRGDERPEIDRAG